MAHLPRIPVWLPSENSVVYFITLCIKDRKPVMANVAAFDAFKNVAIRGIRAGEMVVHA
jgi:hypothetical protein